MNTSKTRLILKNLINNEEYCRKVLPFIKDDYFEAGDEKKLFTTVNGFLAKYNNLPTYESLAIEIKNDEKITESEYKKLSSLLEDLQLSKDKPDQQWLIDQTEVWCQDRAVYNGLIQSIGILDGKDKKLDRGAIPQIMMDALAVSFDTQVGHDFFDMAEIRFDGYKRKEEKIPFDLDMMNRITRGGVSRKTLNVILAGTNVGKSLAMCSMAAANLAKGYNVCYISGEMSEEEVAKRIDANLLDIAMDNLEFIDKGTYLNRLNQLKSQTQGRLIIKEYPTASAHVGHFRQYLNELYLKQSVRPDIIYVDYLNIFLSSRLRSGANTSQYSYVKAVSEELRGLAVEYNVPIITASQFNRGGFGSSDPDMTDISESFGVNFTADLVIALISSDELAAAEEYLVKQLKSRYSDINRHRKFRIGVDKPHMRLYDVEGDATDGVIDDAKVNENGDTKFQSVLKDSNSVSMRKVIDVFGSLDG